MLDSFLRSVDPEWPATLGRLYPRIHAVDRDATRIWFSLYPLLLHERSEVTGDRAAFEVFYQLRGPYRLQDAIHTSHRFLYGHRFWPAARRATLSADVAGTLEETVAAVARQMDHPEPLSLGIAAIALMTLRQAPERMRTSEPAPSSSHTETPEAWLKRREAKPGFFGRLTSKPRIVFNEQDPAGSFPLNPTQDITMAACEDKRPYHLHDPRCFEDMGPIPVECRSGSCGTCWVGVLGGNENLSPATAYERKRMEYLGYWDAGFEDRAAARPLIRLACQTQASGPASIVIPPWCGVFGPTRREREPGRHNEGGCVS
ncbi:MAG: (2Fe-2S)-binding protein [Bryobacteraceae bacterium]|nr:(2Fe-2S)-binding protein [Bryobacteraceae bacterium]